MDDIRFRAVSGHHDYGYDTTPGEAPNRAASPSGLATPTQNGFGYRPTNLGSMLSPVAPVVGAEDGPSFMDKVRGLTYDEQGGARPWSISQRLRAAGPSDEFGLPTQGRIRFVPEEGYNPLRPLPRGPNGGYIDRFGNEWVVGPSRTPGQPFEWNLQLSRTGQAQLGWLSPDENMAHINVSPLGEVTH
jgi:hypothetical protein